MRSDSNTKKTYEEWKELYEKDNNLIVLDDDGGRVLEREGKLDLKMSKRECTKYLLMNTIIGKEGSFG